MSIELISAFIIKYEDNEVEDEIFSGYGAEEGALKRFEQLSLNWNCSLFQLIKQNFKD